MEVPLSGPVLRYNGDIDCSSFDSFDVCPSFRICDGRDASHRIQATLSMTAIAVFPEDIGKSLETGAPEILKVLKAALLVRLQAQATNGTLFQELAALPDQDVYDVQFGTESVGELIALMRAKRCAWQVRQMSGMFCLGDSGNGARSRETDLGPVGPTTAPACRDCAMPDDSLRCSHVVHPNVVGIGTLGTRGIQRTATAMCGFGHEGAETDLANCIPGGHSCWEQLVEVADLAPAAPPHPLELHEALDSLDAVWRLAFDKGKRLLSRRSATVLGSLSQPCASREEFADRMSSLAQCLDLKIDGEAEGALNRMKDKLIGESGYLTDPGDRHDVGQAIADLQGLIRIRSDTQHASLLTAVESRLHELGIGHPTNWSEAWLAVRSRATSALRVIRGAIRRVVDETSS